MLESRETMASSHHAFKVLDVPLKGLASGVHGDDMEGRHPGLANGMASQVPPDEVVVRNDRTTW